MHGSIQSEKPRRTHRKVFACLTVVVVMGGVVSLILSGDDRNKEPEEEIVIVDLTAPPPPPPPVEPEEEVPPAEEEPPEPSDTSDTEAPDDLAESPSEEIDLGLDVGDLDSGPGGGFAIEIPKFGTRGGGGGEDPFGADMDSPPMPVNRMPPQYPGALLKKGIGGRVMVTCVIDAKGAIVSAKIKESSGQPDLDKSALQAVQRWKFKPAQRGGKSVQATCHIPFTFEIKRS